MASIWTMDIPTIVFSRIVSDFSEDLKTKYKMQKITVNGITTWRNFSTSQVSETPPIFPYITIVKSAGQERGMTTEKGVEGEFFLFQIDAFDNQNEKRASDCIWEVARILVDMGFTGNPTPFPNSKPQEYRMTARYGRTIGNNSIL